MGRLARIERPLLYGTVGCTLFGAMLLVVSISTDHWMQLNFPRGIYRNQSKGYVISHHSGLWRICRREIFNHTLPVVKKTSCASIKLFPSSEIVDADPEVDEQILNYSRSETAFAVISVVFVVFAHLFAIYAIREPRYMFKRLAGMLYLITAKIFSWFTPVRKNPFLQFREIGEPVVNNARLTVIGLAVSLLVAIEVLMNSVNYEKEHLARRHPEGSRLSYGYSFVLAWIVFLIYLAASIIYFVCSKKRKRDKARSEKEAIENEPIHLGRI